MPRQYDKTTHDGKTVDWLTHAALLEAELRLGYRLTIVQGSYHKGVGASAGTHDGGGVIDLAPWHWQEKVKTLRGLGFAIWHRPTLPGVWNEHCHGVLIGNTKLAPVAARQVTDYRNHRDGLASHRADNSWHPDPIPTYKWPGSDAALALEKKAREVLDGKKPTPSTPGWHPSTGRLPVDLLDLSHWNESAKNGTVDLLTTAQVKKALSAGVKGFYLKATEGTSWVDPFYADRRKRINLAGGDIGAYHFARPAASDGTSQAKHFLSVAKPKRGKDFRLMLDLEDDGGKTKAALTKWVREFYDECVRQLGLRWFLLYTHYSLDDAAGWYLWTSRYSNSNALPVIPAPFKRWRVRQFSDGAYGNPKTVPGFTKVDLNNVVGPVSALKMPPVKKPPPPPPPPPPPVDPTPGDLTITATFANVKCNPKMPQMLVAEDLATIAGIPVHGAPIYLGAEIAIPRYVDAWTGELKDKRKSTTYNADCECPVSLRRADWAVHDKRVRKMHGGVLHVTPWRPLSIVRAIPNGGELKVAGVASHFVSGGYSDHYPATKALRRRLWNEHWAAMRERVEILVENGWTVVIGFDANRTNLPVLHPSQVVATSHGIDHLLVVPAADVVVKVNDRKRTTLNSDHDAITASFTLTKE